jgi:hypothetical protein
MGLPDFPQRGRMNFVGGGSGEPHTPAVPGVPQCMMSGIAGMRYIRAQGWSGAQGWNAFLPWAIMHPVDIRIGG